MVLLGLEPWRQMVLEGAGQVGVGLTSEMIDQLAYHCQYLLKWNTSINLTAITDPMDIAVKHLIDSLSIIPYLTENKKILDIGSGGGFPGIPIAIARPELSVTLIDAVAKKVSFLKAVIRGLPLPNCQSNHFRIEPSTQSTNGKKSEKLGSFDAIVSRALADPQMCLRLATPYLAPNGSIIMMRGRVKKDTTASLYSLCNEIMPHYEVQIDIFPVHLPFRDDIRHIVVMKTRANRL